MKQFFILIIASLAFILPAYAQPGKAPFANRYLSNLRSPTAINVNLRPAENDKVNLGLASKNWKDLYLKGNIYKGIKRFLTSDNLGNTFLGILAGKDNIGTLNTALGENALFSNIEGSENTAIGYQALYNNNSFGNGAFGRGNLYSNTTGFFNVASGWAALYNNTEGYANVAIGALTLVANITGVENTAIGSYALSNSNTTNSFNTAIGSDAAGSTLDCSNATFLGAHTSSDSGLVNITAVGWEAHATASNQVMVGNSSVTSIGGYANWSNFSDGRYKKNVQEDVPGLEFITQLRPVTYTLDVDGIETRKSLYVQRLSALNIPGLSEKIPSIATAFAKREIQQQAAHELKAKQEKAKVVYTGFIAQEVEQAAKKLNYDFSGVDAPKTEKSFYALRYGDFVVPLVKAVQEQQKQLDDQQKQIEELKALIQSLKKQDVSNITHSSAFLKQNVPNPFNKQTIISYYIPGNVGHAQILVTDMKGSLIKTYTVTKGEGQVNIGNGELPAATYNYTLLVNGKKMDTRQMIITK